MVGLRANKGEEEEEEEKEKEEEEEEEEEDDGLAGVHLIILLGAVIEGEGEGRVRHVCGRADGELGDDADKGFELSPVGRYAF